MKPDFSAFYVQEHEAEVLLQSDAANAIKREIWIDCRGWILAQTLLEPWAATSVKYLERAGEPLLPRLRSAVR